MTQPLNDATRAQIRAADPLASTWVSANAGAGKTTVLINRVARLLLAGTPPQKILCLTYTKAAASEMQNRLFKRLGAWTMMEDDSLADALAALNEDRIAPHLDDLARARRLFAMALDTPGGLKIQTIHSFCDTLLRRFPLEAGVSPNFQVLDDRSAVLLRNEVLEEMARQSEAGINLAFDNFAATETDLGIEGIADIVSDNRGPFGEIASRGDFAKALGHGKEPRPEDIDAALWDGTTDADLRHAADALRRGKVKDQDAAQAIRLHLDSADRETVLAAFDGAFLTGEKLPRSSKGFPTKGVLQIAPDVGDIVDRLKTNTQAAYRLSRISPAIDRAQALHAFGHLFLSIYTERKSRIGMLDYGDLIDRTRRLLTMSDMAAWALYKLDGGIDHILIDEAQDTSPAQWDVITALTQEFHAGAGARDVSRSLFVVGDEKQSIYSFQGAVPEAFGEKRGQFAGKLSAVGSTLHATELQHSFRSAPVILSLVDAVFGTAGWDGLRHDGMTGQHIAFKDQMPGRVEVWPFLEIAKEKDERPWDDLEPLQVAENPKLTLARVLAEEIARRLASGDRLPGRDAPLQPGDILILVQRRDQLAQGIVRALKSLNVPVAGQDRMFVGRELAVKDLLTVLRFLDTPQDDLSLAAALRSPIFGMTEEALFSVAHGRGDRILWQALRECGPAETVACLNDLRDQTDFLRPYELLERLLVRHRARENLLARLGDEIEDAIDELLSQAIAWESEETPSLTGFLRWIDAKDIAIKREFEADDNLVRVMSVHGAKGQEAPMVILPDTSPRKLHSETARTGEIGGLPFAHVAGKLAPEALLAKKAEQRRLETAERRRLLYVAMTRAESLLLVCGAHYKPPDEACWYGLVSAGLDALEPREVAAPEGLYGSARVLGADWEGAGLADAVTENISAAETPSWIALPPPPPLPAPSVLNPSDLGGAHAIAGAKGDTEERAKARGRGIHTLIERLAPLDADERRATGPDLAASLFDHDPAEALNEAIAALSLPDVMLAIENGGRFEASLFGQLPDRGQGQTQMMGRIDLLHVTDTHVRAIDFKSNRIAPGTPDETPDGILRQMGAYQHVLDDLYPRKIVETALVWTVLPRFVSLPRTLVMESFARTPTTS